MYMVLLAARLAGWLVGLTRLIKPATSPILWMGWPLLLYGVHMRKPLAAEVIRFIWLCGLKKCHCEITCTLDMHSNLNSIFYEVVIQKRQHYHLCSPKTYLFTGANREIGVVLGSLFFPSYPYFRIYAILDPLHVYWLLRLSKIGAPSHFLLLFFSLSFFTVLPLE